MIRLRSASARHVVESKQSSLSPRVAELRLFKPVFVRAVGNKFLYAVLLCWLLCLQPAAAEQQQASEELNAQLKMVSANGVQLHYLERGQGTPLIFLHGGLGDYREWLGEIGAFSEQYRVIDYSRRYDYPNTNPPIPTYSASTDASDLAGLLDALNLDRVHLVSYSYGAYASLFLRYNIRSVCAVSRSLNRP